MIYLKQRKRDHNFRELEAKLDDEGWFKLSFDFIPSDFDLCTVKIDGVIYTENSPKFWEAYNKFLPFHILSRNI